MGRLPVDIAYDPPEDDTMTDQPLPAEPVLQIRKPCPKSWDELTGDDKKRFCSECSLHVLDAAHLSQDEARDLVANATARVCMRLQLDSSGAPIFRDSAAVRAEPVDSGVRRPTRRIARMAQWALSAAAGVLAACHGSTSGPAPNDPGAVPTTGETPTRMGKVCTTAILGDVAAPPMQLLGEAVVAPAPAPAPAPPVTPPKDDE